MKKQKATSAGIRWKVKPTTIIQKTKKLTRKLIQTKTYKAGRNNQGKITTNHRGKEHKRKLRIIDFKRDKTNLTGIIESIEYDPNRNTTISLIKYTDGERRYILTNKNSTIGDTIISAKKAAIKTGNAMQLKAIPIGTKICCIENRPHKGAIFARAAGTSFTLINNTHNYAIVKTAHNEIRKINNNCKATIGEIGNQDKYLEKLGKAGRKRLKGIRPTVRGVAMNPVDHPHGGGEGKTSTKRHPVNFKGKKTKGFKTRKNKRTNKMIITQ